MGGTVCEMMSGCNKDVVTVKLDDCYMNPQCYIDLGDVAATDQDLTAYWQDRVWDQDTGTSWIDAEADDGVATITCDFKKNGLQKDGDMCPLTYGTQFGVGGFGYYDNDGFNPNDIDLKGRCVSDDVFAIDLKYYGSARCDGGVSKQVRYLVNEDNCINTSDNEGNLSSMMVHCNTFPC